MIGKASKHVVLPKFGPIYHENKNKLINAII